MIRSRLSDSMQDSTAEMKEKNKVKTVTIKSVLCYIITYYVMSQLWVAAALLTRLRIIIYHLLRYDLLIMPSLVATH